MRFNAYQSPTTGEVSFTFTLTDLEYLRVRIPDFEERRYIHEVLADLTEVARELEKPAKRG